jgi:hypothetical protein
MISCLTDYIGLRDVQNSPSSGLYVNDLPGITTQQFTDTRSQEIAALESEWDAIEKRAIRGFESDLKFHLRKYFKNHQTIGTEVTGYVDDDVVVDHGAGVYSGVLIDFYGQSENLKINVNKAKLYLTGAATFNVKIFDANTGTELFTKSVSGTAGLNEVDIFQEFTVYDYNRLFVCYDTVLPYKMYDVPAPWVVSSQKISTSSTILHEDMTGDETGIAVNYSIKCGIDEFVCNRLDLFEESYLYRLGIEFLKQAHYSDRFNRYTLLGRERREEMLMDFKEQYKENLDSALKDLKVRDDGVCFICNKAINQKVLIP